MSYTIEPDQLRGMLRASRTYTDTALSRAAAGSSADVLGRGGSATIPVAAWTAETSGRFAQRADVPVEGVSVHDRADVTVTDGEMTAALCGIAPICATGDGTVTIYADTAPDGEIQIDYWITRGAQS